MRRILSLLVAISLVICALPASALESEEYDYDNEQWYEEQVARILSNYSVDPEAAIRELAKLDTILVQIPTVVNHYPATNARQTYPSDYTLTVSAYKRSNSSVFYLQWILETSSTEKNAGPLDFVSIEWDTACASYYSSSGDGTFSTVQSSNTGIIVFNLEDHKLTPDDIAYGTVKVDPIVSGWMVFGSKFVHTYSSSNVTGGTASISFSPSASLSASGIPSLGLAYTQGYQVTVAQTVSQWQIWTDNAVDLYFS